MSDPVETYGAEILVKNGIKITGNTQDGLRGTVRYLLSWKNAYLFTSAIVAPINVARVGAITFRLPYRFPYIAGAMYAQSFEIDPCGVDPKLDPLTPLPNRGLGAGEFFSHAIVTVGFEQLKWAFDLSQDPDGLNQLDPENPIPFCEQSVKIGGKMVNRKGGNYVYADTGTAVTGEVGQVTTEAKLVLKFPHVPYLPWQLLAGFANKVNSSPMLGCAAGTLLLEAPDTTAKASLNSPTPIEQDLTLQFAWDPKGWNNLPHADGTYAAVRLKGDSSRSIYDLIDHRQIFTYLSYSEEVEEG